MLNIISLKIVPVIVTSVGLISNLSSIYYFMLPTNGITMKGNIDYYVK